MATSGGSLSRRATAVSTPSSETCEAFAPNQRCWTSQSLRTCSSSWGSSGIALAFLWGRLLEQEPEEPARRQRQQVGQLADAREARAAQHLDREPSGEFAQVQLNGLRAAGQVVHAQRDVV